MQEYTEPVFKVLHRFQATQANVINFGPEERSISQMEKFIYSLSMKDRQIMRNRDEGLTIKMKPY